MTQHETKNNQCLSIPSETPIVNHVCIGCDCNCTLVHGLMTHPAARRKVVSLSLESGFSLLLVSAVRTVVQC